MDSRDTINSTALQALPRPIRPTVYSSRSPSSTPENSRAFRARVVGIGLARYWKVVLPLWVFGSITSMALVYFKVKASYEASSLVRLEPGMVLFTETNNNDAANKYLATQVNLFLSNQVLKAALQDDQVKKLAMVRDAEDPINEIYKALWVSTRPNTFLVDVKMRSDSLEESETIVNAVVNAFVKYQKTINKQSSERNLKSLNDYKSVFEQRIQKIETELTAEVGASGYPTSGLSYTKKTTKQVGEVENRNQDNPGDSEIVIRENEYRGVVMTCVQAEMKLREAEAYLEQLKKRVEESQAFAMSGNMELDRQEHDLKTLMNADPELVQAQAKLKRAQDNYDNAIRVSKKPLEPAVTKARQYLQAEQASYDSTVSARRKRLRDERNLAHPVEGITDSAKLANAEDAVHRAKAAWDAARNAMESMKKEAQQQAKSMVRADLRQTEVNVLRDMVSTLERQIQQKTFDRDTTTEERVMVIDQARGSPITDKRIRYMIVAPILVLGLLVLGVVVLEVRSGRVTHPDDLSSRLRTEVFTVPPLPTLRSATLDDQHSLSRLEEFAQRMDHLRVALCGPSMHSGGRCVMITSAIGGEGKTTLAAQLAGRCANAGLSTLLIDADLRRPMLARLLEVPEQPGLADVLGGDVEPELALVVIGSAGGFHLLPAGTVGSDPGRLFSGPNFGQLVQRLRAAFDIVIVDTPPILPVPDALQLGRWSDGAVLAARHDSSRSHLVERANQLLISAGIPLLGVVVNGVRPSESVYGGYASYASYRTPDLRGGSTVPT